MVHLLVSVVEQVLFVVLFVVPERFELP